MISFPTNPPTFQLPQHTLRAVTPTDAPALYHFMSDKTVTQYTNLHATSLSQVADWIKTMTTLFQNKQAIYWVITDTHDYAIGRCQLFAIDHKHSKAEIGYHLAKEHWNRGITTQAVTTIVNYAFQHLNLNRIEATTHLDNHASSRVLEKIGFTKEAIQKQHRYQNGKFYDINLFSKLKTD